MNIVKKKIFVSGSIAYDYLMTYDGVFKDAILVDKLHHLNVAFVAKDKSMSFGGCGGNISYSLSLLKEKSILYSVVGNDFDTYEKWLNKNNISTDLIGKDKENSTAAAYVMTDKNENQITMFCPSAMGNINYNVELDKKTFLDVDLAIISPDICERSLYVGKKLIEAHVPYFFDPGQMTPAFTTKDLRFLLENAYGFIANHYEVTLFCERLNMKIEDLVNHVDIFVETRGEKGAILRTKKNGEEFNIPAVKPQKIVNPTGCGDAFRAGLLAGLHSGLDAVEACKKGALLAARSIECAGTQCHKI